MSNSKKILLIGGSGYLGSALHDFLVEEHHWVQDIDVGWFGIHKSEKRNYHEITDQELKQFDVAILLASQSTVGMCADNPLSVKESVYYFAEFAQKCAKNKVALIYSSSSIVYRGLENADENAVLPPPATMYDFCMLARDQLAQLTPSLHYYGLRFGVLAGFSPNLRTDIMLNAFVKSFRETGVITVFNENAIRPMLSIFDACRAIQNSIFEMEESKKGIYNLANCNKTILEYAEETAKLLGAKIEKKTFTKTDSFGISSEKFKKTFDFDFLSDVRQVVKELDAEWDYSKIQTTRN